MERFGLNLTQSKNGFPIVSVSVFVSVSVYRKQRQSKASRWLENGLIWSVEDCKTSEYIVYTGFYRHIHTVANTQGHYAVESAGICCGGDKEISA